MNSARSEAAASPAMIAPAVRAPGRWQRLAFSEASLSAAKWLAVVLMVIDHWNHYLLSFSAHWMMCIGRVSMPLFAVVLGYNLSRPGQLASGGYARTALRLAVFGAIATVPFIALNKLAGGWWPLNMMFTLLVATLVAWMWDDGRPWPVILSFPLLLWSGCLSEYWWPGIGLVLAVWAYQRSPSAWRALSFMICMLLLYFINHNMWALAALPVLALVQWWKIPLPRAQWLFYAFYPVHLCLFWLYLHLVA